MFKGELILCIDLTNLKLRSYSKHILKPNYFMDIFKHIQSRKNSIISALEPTTWLQQLLKPPHLQINLKQTSNSSSTNSSECLYLKNRMLL